MPGATRHHADETSARCTPDDRHIADQAVTLPTKPPKPICIFDEAVGRRFNDGQHQQHPEVAWTPSPSTVNARYPNHSARSGSPTTSSL
jgi:D-hexose-6-phosphate mutarotase